MEISKLPLIRKIKEEIDKEPFLLSHHPLCEKYESHLVEIRGYKVCMGCLFTYPSALATILIVNLLYSVSSYGFELLFYLGLIFFGIALIRKLFLDDNSLSKQIHILFRVVLGISLGFEISAIEYAEGESRLFLIVFVASFIVIYNIANGIHTRKTCKTCEQYPLFPNCDGWPDNRDTGKSTKP